VDIPYVFRRASPDMRAQVYPTCVVHRVINTLCEEGIDPAAALADTGIRRVDELASPSARVSIGQMLGVFANARSLSQDPMFAVRAGRCLHVTALGAYGYALMSSPSHEAVIDLVDRYDCLANPFMKMRFARSGAFAVWHIGTITSLAVDDPLYRFLVELKLSATLRVIKDLYHEDVSFARVRMRVPAPAYAGPFDAEMGCKVEYAAASEEAWFDAALMSLGIPGANPIAHAMMREQCDQLLRAVDKHNGWAERVESLLYRDLTRFSDFEAVGRELGKSPRTLQRKLTTEGTSFREILQYVRSATSATLLRTTDLSIEAVAEQIGYSDAANFRHAFARWNGVSPSSFRKQAEVGSCHVS
jgi:AraC-like DNA-binding protein